jgi:hypothetical protein
MNRIKEEFVKYNEKDKKNPISLRNGIFVL